MIAFRYVLALVTTLVPINASVAADKSIVLASTTSVEASGLLANILPQFTAKTGITVNVVAQGTGKALDTARRGDADVVLVHDPEAEREFVGEGYGSTLRQIAWNDFIIVGLPTALVGGFIVLDERLYKTVTGLVLLLAATILALPRAHDGEPDRPTPFWGATSTGAAVGFVSGLTGVGGGVFLAPLLIALQWASPKQTAALSAPFILANSVVGLAGAIYAGQTPTADTWLFALAALGGAMIGAIVGLHWLSQTMTRYVLAAILGAAGVQLLSNMVW